jgi:dihydrofolate reductase
MRKIISIHQVTLDGVIQGPGGPDEDTSGGFTHGGWVQPFVDESIGEEIDTILSSGFDLLLGRRTYEIWKDYWPKHTDNPIGAAFDKATKYVASNTLDKLEWQKGVQLSDDVATQVRKLKEEGGPNFHVWGSGKLMQTLLAEGLIDEMRHWVIPVVLGEGKRFFESGLPASTFSLSGSRTTSKGVQINTYHPAGPLKTGSMA